MEEIRYQLDLLKAMNQKLESNVKMYQSLCDTSTSAFLYYNFQQDRLETLGNWDEFFSFRINNIKEINRIIEEMQEQYHASMHEIMFLEKTGLEVASKEMMYVSKRKWLECETNVIYDPQKNPIEKVIRFKDISKFKSQNDELAYLAYYDSLTGLYNRNYFVRILAEWMRNAQDDKSVVAVMFIDMDDFRKINDGMGMIVGDETVQVLGQFLGTLRQDKVIVSHFNSDIYCIAIYDPCGLRSVETLYKTIQERLEKPFKLTNHIDIKVTVCVGVAEFPEASKTALELINCAEIVMFKAKTLGKNNIQYFDAPILNDFLKNINIENKLKAALFEKQFILYYQPQYNVLTGKLRGVEALIRWRDGEGTMISPGEFIPIAERNGTIVPIGNWVIEEAIKTQIYLKKTYKIDFIMSVNISAIQYKQPEFVGDLIAILTENEISPEDIELEITESILIDDFKEVIEKMYALRDYGIKVSLDDFGTGFSSLSYLKGLPIDTLKIDKSFIDSVTYDESTRTITESIIHMVKRLGFETIAEGVETKEQMDYLKEIDCDNIQGFYLARPMDRTNLEILFTKLL